MASNGNIPSSQLGDIPGSNAGLRKDAARSYKAMHYASLKQTGVSLAITDGQVGRTYRSYARQVLAKRIYGSNAATPGYSNHGWAVAVDLMTTAQRNAIDRIGRSYGWAKAWSDASWEWWHLRWRDVGWKPRPDPLRFLGKRRRAACEMKLYHTREAIREARTGKGPRYRRHVRWRNFWRRRVEKYHRRAKAGVQKRVMARVLADRNGHI